MTTSSAGRLGMEWTQMVPLFQLMLRAGLLAKVGGLLSVTIFVINVVLGRPVIDAVLFSLAVAVGITPQLLPAVVSTSLATGSRRLADKKVLVKRLVCIEDLGDIDVLFTDISLPGGMNGAELAERGREMRPEMPIVYVSGRYKLSEISPLVPRSLFVAKPYDPNDICALLTRLIGGRGAPA